MADIYVHPLSATNPAALNRIQSATGCMAVIDGTRARLIPYRQAGNPRYRVWHATATANDDYTPPPAAA